MKRRSTHLYSNLLSTQIVVNGWATYSVYGPFHRFIATCLVHYFEQKAYEIEDNETHGI